MQSEDVIWQVINTGFCSYKVKTTTSNFCRNENNLTGQCNRQSCPLANHRYATVREIDGVCYLYHKVVERAHMPAKMWEKIKLKGSLEQVKAKIQKHLEYMPKFFEIKCLARYERIQEYLRRSIKLQNDPNQPILTVRKDKVIRRETKREARAKKVALIENAIEKELVSRLQKGVYGEIYNLPQKTFESVLEKHGQRQEMEEVAEEDDNEEQVEYVEGWEDDVEEEEEEEEIDYEKDFVPSEVDSDLEDIIHPTSALTKKKARVEIEYEMEDSLPTFKLAQ